MTESSPTPARLRAEFAALFLAAPVLQLCFFQTLGVFGPIALVCALATMLLHVTPGWYWRELIDLRGLSGHLPWLGAFIALSATGITALVMALRPGELLTLPRERTGLWLAIMAFYPVLSVLGQEIVFRPLFFRRYGCLFRRPDIALLANAVTFSLAHAFYQNWVAIALTFAGGLAFGHAYQRTGSFPLIFLMHALAGQMIFTLGLGAYFYHGAIAS